MFVFIQFTCNRVFPALTGNNADFALLSVTVVIAIIAILAAMLLPALSAARERARMSNCTSNLKTYGLACIMYADDHKGQLPPSYNMLPDYTGSWGGYYQSGTGRYVLWKGGYYSEFSSGNVAEAKFREKYFKGLDAIENFFVTPKETDSIIESAAMLLARSLNEAFVIRK